MFFRVCRVCSLLCCAKLKQTAESCILFFCLILQKSKDYFFYCKCTQIKADLLQFRLSSWPRGVASTVRRGINPVIAPALHALKFKHSTFTMQPVHYHYKNNWSNIWKKHTALFKYVVKSVLLSVIKSNQIKSNHFYCHITTAQVPWWVKFLWACSRQRQKNNNNLHMDRQCKKTTNYLHMDRQCKKTALEHLQCSRQCKNFFLHMDSTYLQTVQKTMCKIHIHILSTV